ncbi:MAG: AI-2E family transporter [Candidatus Promineifilaceae bacterium]|nr:AI-2E family transporter [Candidatus Promineifilaceae bacterium]
MDHTWSRNTRAFVLLITAGILLALVYAARELLGPLIIAALLAYVLNPLVTFVNRRSKLPRSLVVALLYLLSLGALVLLVVLFAPPLIAEAQALTTELQSISSQIQMRLTERITILGFEMAPGEIMGVTETFPARFIRSDRILMVLQAASTNLLWILVILVTTYYLLQDWEKLRDWLLGLAPAGAQADVRRLYIEVKVIWQSYLRGQLVLMVTMALLTGLALVAVGMPGAAALGVLTGLFDVIPTIGPTIALIVTALVAWFEGSNYLPLSHGQFTALVIALYLLIQWAENAYLRRRVMDRSVQIHPAVVFIGIIGALSMVGILGALVVVPVLGTVAKVGEYLRRRMLGAEPWPEADGDETGERARGNEAGK